MDDPLYLVQLSGPQLQSFRSLSKWHFWQQQFFSLFVQWKKSKYWTYTQQVDRNMTTNDICSLTLYISNCLPLSSPYQGKMCFVSVFTTCFHSPQASQNKNWRQKFEGMILVSHPNRCNKTKKKESEGLFFSQVHCVHTHTVLVDIISHTCTALKLFFSSALPSKALKKKNI